MTVFTGKYQTFGKEVGNGPSIVFIHGVGMDHMMWSSQTLLLEKQFHVITYDMLGHGRSQNVDEGTLLDNFVEQLKELLDLLDVKQTHIVGFSMGGFVAQAFSLKYPNYVQTMTLLNVVADRSEQQRANIADRVQQVRIEGHKSTIAPAIKRWFTEEFSAQNPACIQGVRERLESNHAPSYVVAYAIFASADKELWPKLSLISRPCLIITGEYDIGSTVEMSKKMADAIKWSQVHIVEGQKHMLPLEKPEIVCQKILQWIDLNASNRFMEV